MSIWKSNSYETKKPWGSEIGFGSPFGMSGKIINLKADQRTSLKYYRTQSQMMYCLHGEVSVFAPNEKEFGDSITEAGSYFLLKPNDVILIQSTNPYRISALKDSKLIEVIINKSPLASSDVVMLEDDYGRQISENTEEEDII